MNDRDTQAKIDKRIALSLPQKDEWENIVYPDLSKEANTAIRVARRLGYATFHPADVNGQLATLRGARKHIKECL